MIYCNKEAESSLKIVTLLLIPPLARNYPPMTQHRAKQLLLTSSHPFDELVSFVAGQKLTQYTQKMIENIAMIILLLIINNPAQANPAMSLFPKPQLKYWDLLIKFAVYIWRPYYCISRLPGQ